MSKKTSLTRRSFLKSGSIALSASTISASSFAAAEKNEEKATILNQKDSMAYRRLGDTDIYLSAISLGGLVMEPDVHRYGIEKGVNLVHISTSYIGGTSIVELGKIMKDMRDKVYISLKDNFIPYGQSKDAILKKFDGVLKTLNTDYIDFFMFNRHNGDDAAGPEIEKMFEMLKNAGKVRYAGLTSHNPKIKESTHVGIESGLYSLVMPAMNPKMFDAMQEEMRMAAEKNVGVMVMKSMSGVRGREMQIAYIKKLMKNPAITTILKGIGSFEMFEDYTKAAKEVLTSQEDWSLYRYAQANPDKDCMLCGECTRNCPQGVDPSTIMRCSNYYYDQCGDLKQARATYDELPANQRADCCVHCGKCEEGCPNGLPIREHLTRSRILFA